MKAIIWGHKLHSHTHSYIHEAFYRAFLYLGWETYWMDASDDVSGFNFANSLFLTEGQVDQGIPIRSDCKYILHYCDPHKYLTVGQNCIFLERTLGHERRRLLKKSDVEKIDEWTFLEKEYQGSVGWKKIEAYGIPALYMLWGTNLLPHEIKTEWAHRERTNNIHWVGSVGTGVYGNVNELGPFSMAALVENNPVKIHTKSPIDNHIKMIQQSFLAPTIVGTWQLQHGYIPCRAFKNISYGQMTCTNSRDVASVFDGRIVANSDTFQLFYDARSAVYNVQRDDILSQTVELMDFVRQNHTYVNRINAILEVLK